MLNEFILIKPIKILRKKNMTEQLVNIGKIGKSGKNKM